MTWTSEDGIHEGWAAAEFPDGRVSTGSSGAGMTVQTPEDAIRFSGGKSPADVVDRRTAIGWRSICTCGWLGPLWRRVPTVGGHDPARHRIYWAAPYDLDDDHLEMDAIRAEWKAHLPHETLAEVTAAAEDARKADARLDDAVGRARAAGQTWEAIGSAAGMTRQAANERWRTR